MVLVCACELGWLVLVQQRDLTLLRRLREPLTWTSEISEELLDVARHLLRFLGGKWSRLFCLASRGLLCRGGRRTESGKAMDDTWLWSAWSSYTLDRSR